MLGSCSEAEWCGQLAFVDPGISQLRAGAEKKCVLLRGAFPLVNGRVFF